MSPAELEALQVGDQVLVARPHTREVVVAITRSTKRVIEAGGVEYRRRGGHQSGDGYLRGHIVRIATPDDIAVQAVLVQLRAVGRAAEGSVRSLDLRSVEQLAPHVTALRLAAEAIADGVRRLQEIIPPVEDYR